MDELEVEFTLDRSYWNEKVATVFVELKEAMTSLPIIAMSNFEKEL